MPIVWCWDVGVMESMLVVDTGCTPIYKVKEVYSHTRDGYIYDAHEKREHMN